MDQLLDADRLSKLEVAGKCPAGKVRIMSLINVNNAQSIEVESRSIQLHSISYGTSRYLDVSHIGAEASVLFDLADGDAPVDTVRAATYALNAMLVNSRSLYSLQSMLNDPMWKVLQLTVEVEAGVTVSTLLPDYTNHPNMALIVKTTWQDERPTLSMDEI